MSKLKTFIMAEETNEKEVLGINQGILKLNNALSGLPGANDIMQQLGEEAIKTGDIKMVKVDGSQLEKIPETAKTSDIPLMKDEEKKPEGEKKPAAEKKVETDEEEITNPILKSMKQTSKKGDVTFENFDQVKATIKKDFGIEIKDEKDFGKVINSSKKWREDAAKLPELEEQIGQFNKLFEEMPAPLLDSMKAFFAADPNWDRPIVSRPRFDFSKPVENQNIKELVKHYFPDDFTKEDFEAEEKSPALKIAEKAAKDRFVSDKNGLEEKSAAQVRQSTERLNSRKASIASSLTILKQSFPEIDKAEEKRLTKALESGDINSLFINKDGSFKPDAAKKLFLAEYGEGAIENLMKMSAKRAESKANEDILTRGADTPKPKKGGAVGDEKTIEVMKVVNNMTQGMNKKRTY